MAKEMKTLSPELVEFLKGEQMVSLVTIDAETHQPQLSVVSWVVASEDGKQIKIAVGHKGSTVSNIQANSNIILGSIGPESCFSIKGKATLSEVIERTMKFRVITIEVELVEDVMFYGGRVTKQAEYEKTYDPDLAKKLDGDVQELLRK